MRTAIGVVLLSASLIATAAEEPWSFVWVGTTADSWLIVEGTGVAKFHGSDVHFDLTAKNSEKYLVDAKLNQGTVEVAGLAGVGSAYRGITFMTGTHTEPTAKLGSLCGVEVLQLHNEYNSLTIKRKVPGQCK